jgi:hypothetical protein
VLQNLKRTVALRVAGVGQIKKIVSGMSVQPPTKADFSTPRT